MQSEAHDVLYRKLADITSAVQSALIKEDIKTLNGLAEQHQTVMYALKKAGFGRDPQLRALVQQIAHQVQKVVVEMERRRDQTRCELKAHANRRKLARAYG